MQIHSGSVQGSSKQGTRPGFSARLSHVEARAGEWTAFPIELREVSKGWARSKGEEELAWPSAQWHEAKRRMTRAVARRRTKANGGVPIATTAGEKVARATSRATEGAGDESREERRKGIPEILLGGGSCTGVAFLPAFLRCFLRKNLCPRMNGTGRSGPTKWKIRATPVEYASGTIYLVRGTRGAMSVMKIENWRRKCGIQGFIIDS